MFIAFILNSLINNDQLFDRSVDVFFSEKIGVDYKVISNNKGSSFTDINAEWEVEVDQISKVNEIVELKFSAADEDDSDYFKSVIKRVFSSEVVLSEYFLYRTELKLGENTFCDLISCSIYVLLHQHNKKLYLGIYKH